MKILRCLSIIALTSTCTAFQFMSKWKMPTHDPNAEKIEERFGDKKLVVITGASSGLGKKAALALLRSGEYHVVGAVRDIDKMEAVAEIDGFDMDNFTPMQCELNDFESVRGFCQNLNEFRMTKPIDRLICNAGVYQPTLDHAKWSKDNHEQTMQINFLSHFLMISQLMQGMIASPDPRVIMVGSVTGNDNTVGGGGVYPIADLHELDGLKAGFKNPIAMADGYGFIGAKAYKDSKLCLMMMANYMHAKYHKLTGISFSSMYPGCIAESPLFREKRDWFRTYFPTFMKFITGGFVGEHEAGQRLFQTAHDPRCSKSGVYWSWNGGPREGRGAEALEKEGQISGSGGAGGGWDSIFENDQSAKVLDLEKQMKLFEYATQITGAEWPEMKQITSPCPTLKVIGAVTQGMVKREELKRMREMGRPGMDANGLPIVVPAKPEETVLSPVTAATSTTAPAAAAAGTTPATTAVPPKIPITKKVVLATDKVASKVLSNTVGRVARFAGRRLLGEVPETAKTGSYHDTAPRKSNEADIEGQHPEDAVVASIETTSSSIEVDEERQSLQTDDVIAELEEANDLLEPIISEQLQKETTNVVVTDVVNGEDEALFQELYNQEKEESVESSSSSSNSPVAN